MPRPPSPARPSRFFVALRPPPEAAARLGTLAAELGRRCKGKALAPADLHLTLAFIGDRPATEAEALARLLAGLPGNRSPTLRLDRIGRFGAGLLWAGPSAMPEELEALAREVRERLDAAGVDYDRRPLQPHLTLVRNARDRGAAASALGDLEPAIEAERWQFALGGTHPDASTAQRYAWHRPAPTTTP